MSKKSKKRNNNKKRKKYSVTDNRTFWASIISAIIVAGGTIYSALTTTTNKIEYVESKTNEWDIENAINYFPLKKGNSWNYEGVLEAVSDKGKKFSRPISMEMEVFEEVSNQDITLFGLTNYFNNIGFLEYSYIKETNKKIEIEKSRTGFLLIANEIYFVPSESYDRVKDEVIRSGELTNRQQITPNIEDLEILYRMPLFSGQRFGAVDQIARSDLSYFWFVNEETEMVTTENNKIITLKEFELIQKGVGFYEKIYLRPYLGVTAYKFDDSRVKIDMKLTSFKVK